ncbi:uncharacterized protein BKA55DRAFT_728069 [Fusarium redolens]|uniref:Uncharacterized protein n=1 Tax=Fusarium redolens TaxID=48865 RepID=A0A9P9H4E5_FUSRE|nr:uncharacterized protein BKA55DRAFT_728069 [Fusarium redolens]KAH7249969.1 hypothetical protein BKA55DRAFT_728069 [Fusarium redolens]
MSSNVSSSDSPEATASTTGPQVLNIQAAHAQQVTTTHQNTQAFQVPQSQDEAQYPPAPFELIEHVDELVTHIPSQQQNGQNLVTDQTNMQSTAGFSFQQQNPFHQQPNNTNLAQHVYGHPSQHTFQYPSHVGQQQYPQMGQQFPSQSAFHFNQQFGNPYLSQQNFQQGSQLQAHPNQYAALQGQRGRPPPQHQSAQGISLNPAEVGNALAMQQPQQLGHPAQQIAPAASPHPICHEVGFKNLLEDQDVVESRDADACVSEHNQLIIKEKMWLHDLIKLYEYVQRKGDVYLSADETYKLFWSTLFKNWNSKMPVSETQSLPARSKSDIHIQVGYYSIDASSNQPENGRRSSKARKCNTIPIYLSLDLDAEGINWLYKDKSGTRVCTQHVKLLVGLSDIQAKHNVLTHYDTYEKNRVCGHNLQLIIESARRRVQKWAIAGGGAPVQLGVECRAPNLNTLRISI